MVEVTNIMEEVQGMLDEVSVYFLAGTRQMIMMSSIVMIVLGLVICCFGLKLSRILSAIIGLALGALLGGAVSLGIGLEMNVLLIVTVAAAVILAVLFGVLRRFGIFFLVLLQTLSVYIGIVKPQNILLAVIGIAVGLLLAVLSIFWTDPFVVLVTGICGGLSAGNAAAVLLGIDGQIWTGYVIGAVAALIGIWIQFMMQSRKIGKKEKVYSRKVREQVSVESEVERARMVLEDDTEPEPEGTESVIVGETDVADGSTISKNNKISGDAEKKEI